MKIKVKAIAPYPGLRDLLVQIAGEDNRIMIDVEIADLDEALPLVLQAVEEDYDVIVSRGGTASLIRKHVSIPVVDIPVSGYDILRVLTLIKDSNSKLAIIGFPNICQGALTISSLMDFEIPIYSISHVSEARTSLEKAIKEGAQIILGDVVTIKIAQEMGHHGILITSGHESIQDMMSEVKRVHDIYLKGHEKEQFFQSILQNCPIGTLVIDKNGAIRYMNDSVRHWMGDFDTLPPELEFLNKVRGIQTEKTHFEYVLVNKKSFSVRTAPSGDDLLIYFEPVNMPSMHELNLVQLPPQIGSFAQIIGSSPEIIKTIKRAKSYASKDGHVWISGETGTGKDIFAESIHSASQRKRGRFFQISCNQSEIKITNELFGSDTKMGLLQIPSNDTLFMESIDKLSVQLQARLATEIRKGTNLRILCSSTILYKKLLRDANFNQELLHVLGEYQLVIPSLRERVEDIEEISRVMIANHNSTYGKQFVGIREEVLSHMMEFHWPGNIKELKNIVGEMLALAKGPYIGLPEWEIVMERYSENNHSNPSYSGIDLKQPWAQIEKSVLKEVLKEEGMNQSKAAKRLGISRATLWRKLT